MTDPWGNPLPPEDQAPANPKPEDYPPDFAPNPAWPGGTSSPSQPLPPPPPPPPHGQPTWEGAPPAWPGYPPPPQAAPAGPKFSGMAIASLVCGILSITCTGFLGIVLGPTALGLGLRSRRTISASNGWRKGDGMAIAGIVLGVIGIVASIVYLVFLIQNPNFLTDLVNNFTTTTTSGKLQGA